MADPAKKLSDALPTMERKLSALTTSAPMEPGELLDELTAMFTVMQSRSAGSSDIAVRLKIYLQDLIDIPRDALLNTVRRFRRGELGDGKWAPMPGEIRRAIQEEQAAEEAARKQAFEKAQRWRDLQNAQETLMRQREQRLARIEENKECFAEVLDALKQSLADPDAKKPWREATEAEARGRIEAWLAGAPQRPVEKFSEKLKQQLMGELPIGEGRLGAKPVVDIE